MQWNLSVQREVAAGWTVMAAYIGTHSVHNAFVEDDPNTVLPTLTSAGYLWPASGGLQLNQSFGRISGVVWSDYSRYNALEAQVTKQLSHNFQMQGSFTWSSSIDGGTSGASLAQPYSNSLPNPFFFESQINRGLSDFNIKDNLVINAIWMAPKPNLKYRAVDYALGGWQLGGIFNAKTGVPFNVLFGGDPLGTLDSTPLDVPNRLTSPGCATAVNPGSVQYVNLSCFALPVPTPAIAAQCAPFSTVPNTCRNLQGNETRNSLIGPGLLDLDFSVFKNNYFGRSERFNAQFRAEIFNILNRTNFDFPSTNRNLFNADGSGAGSAGVLDLTSTSSRQIQFGLKLIW